MTSLPSQTEVTFLNKMTSEEEGRRRAVQMYQILAIVLGLLGAGLLTGGVIAVNDEMEDGEFDFPYYLGAFIVGIMTLAASALCTYIFLKAPDANNEVKKKELGRMIQSHYTLSTLTIMCCILGIFCAGTEFTSGSFLGENRDTHVEDVDYGEDEDSGSFSETLAKAILGGCVFALLVAISSLYIVYTYGPYFGVVIRRGRSSVQIAVMDTGGLTTMPHATTFQTNTQSNVEHIRQLESQNRQLQQQLQQQQEQQQQGTQYGFYPAAPPPSYEESAFRPTTYPR